MYRGSYRDGAPTIPESYGGTAFREDDADTDVKEAPRVLPKSTDVNIARPEPPDPRLSAKEESNESVDAAREVSAGVFSPSGEKPWLSGLLSSFGFSGIGFSKIGTEEILIIGLAIFLFLSKEGDKECALLLLFLLFVH